MESPDVGEDAALYLANAKISPRRRSNPDQSCGEVWGKVSTSKVVRDAVPSLFQLHSRPYSDTQFSSCLSMQVQCKYKSSDD